MTDEFAIDLIRSTLLIVLTIAVPLLMAGMVIGLLISLSAAGLVSGILVDVSPREPSVYLGVTVLLVLVAAAANYLPARRAAHLDPMSVLRRE